MTRLVRLDVDRVVYLPQEVVASLKNGGMAVFPTDTLYGLGVKGGAVLDDLTFPDAQRLGLSAYGELVSNGNRGVGTDLSLCTEDFRRRLHGSDLVLSKGQGNFETLGGRGRNAFCLLRCKCPVISRAVGRPEGEFLLLDSAGRAAA